MDVVPYLGGTLVTNMTKRELPSNFLSSSAIITTTKYHRSTSSDHRNNHRKDRVQGLGLGVTQRIAFEQPSLAFRRPCLASKPGCGFGAAANRATYAGCLYKLYLTRYAKMHAMHVYIYIYMYDVQLKHIPHTIYYLLYNIYYTVQKLHMRTHTHTHTLFR